MAPIRRSIQTLYKAPIKISETTTLKAAGFRNGRQVTRVSVAEYWKFPPRTYTAQIFISDLEAGKPMDRRS